MKKSVEYLTSLYREFGDNAQKALDSIEKNVNENNGGKTDSCANNGGKMFAASTPSLFTRERVDYVNRVFVAKKYFRIWMGRLGTSNSSLDKKLFPYVQWSDNEPTKVKLVIEK